MKGITLIAIGETPRAFAYMRMAYNLAISIKYHSPNIPIQLIYSPFALKTLQPFQRKIFDTLTEMAREDYIDRGWVQPAKAKMSMYKYLVYDETIYLDVDSLVIKNIAPLFDQEKNYACTLVGWVDVDAKESEDMLWAYIPMIVKKYGLKNRIPATNSSFQYIKKGKETEQIFSTMLDIFMNNRVENDDLQMYWGEAKQPDELYLNIALCKMGIDPICEPEPVCYRTDKKLNPKEDYKNHYILSYYGGERHAHRSMVKQYDIEMNKYHMEMNGSRPPYKAHELFKHKYVNTSVFKKKRNVAARFN